MLREAYAEVGTGVQNSETAPAVVGQQVGYAKVAGISLITGAILATLFNVLFPRGDDPSDAAAMLTMMAENEALRQVSFLGVTSGLWLVTIGLAGVCLLLSSGPGPVFARVGFIVLIVGACLFTVSTGIGMVATGAAVDWATGGYNTASAEFAVAAALKTTDDGVWATSIIVYWAAVGLIGLSIVRGGVYPRWLGVPAIVLGFGNAFLVGVPLAYAGVSTTLIIVFAILAQLTIIWAVAIGIWMLRRIK